jgi:hypothetical protein
MVQPRTILIYTKNPIIREALHFLLASYGYSSGIVEDIATLKKHLKNEKELLVIFNDVNEFIGCKWGILKNPFILLRASRDDVAVFNSPNVHILDGYRSTEDIILLINEIMGESCR